MIKKIKQPTHSIFGQIPYSISYALMMVYRWSYEQNDFFYMLQKQNNNTDIARILIAINFTHAPCPFLIKTNKQNPNQNTNQEKKPKSLALKQAKLCSYAMTTVILSLVFGWCHITYTSLYEEDYNITADLAGQSTFIKFSSVFSVFPYYYLQPAGANGQQIDLFHLVSFLLH